MPSLAPEWRIRGFVMVRRFLRGLERRKRDSEHGGVAAVVAVLTAGGVLLGMGALVIDIGRLYVEREQLQSGADAASLEVASNCARANVASCTYPSQGPI